MHGSLKLVGFVVVAIAAAVIAVHQGGVLVGLDDHQQISLLYRLGLLVMVASALAHLFRGRYGDMARMTLIWIGIVLALAVGYTYRAEIRMTGNRIVAELVPGHAVTHGRTVELARTAAGDFHITTEVNHVRVPMVLDTGASTVMLTREAAAAAGLPVEMIKYNVGIETANGRTMAAAAVLERLSVGGIVERSVPALIAQPGTLKTSLLGMSFLSRLEGFEVHGDKVVMRGNNQ